jgi:tRNA threonylcarbamoyladenosine biosynthesis protein TsaE
MTRTTRSEAETMAVARELAATLRAGDVVLLSGDLGAGKTAFVRGLAGGLGANPDDVSSPTFTLVHEYRGGRLPLFHADLYRLQRTTVEELGLDERAIERGVLAIEWPERLAHPIAGPVVVELRIVDEDSRTVTLR